MTANARLRAAAVRHAVYLERYKSGVWLRLARLLDRADIDLVAELQKRTANSELTQYRLELLLEAVREMNAEAMTRYREALRAEMRGLAGYELDYQRRAVQSAVPAAIVADLTVVAPTFGTVYAAALSRPFQGRVLRDWGRSLERSRLQKVQQALRLSVVEGEPVSRAIQRLRGTKAARFRDGVLAISRREAEAVSRTAINHVVTQARDNFYAANKDLVKGWQFVATLDTRTTPECQSLDGKVFPIGEGPMPPRHFNCRSSSVPVLKSWREIGVDRDEVPAGTRASMDGQVAATETYGEWLRKQPAAVQDEALGKAKGRLFRQGGLSVDRFVSPTGRPYSLDELRRREADAFDEAGVE
jgi:SPP1 gp7 family putative phage head morphogenesis protein